MEQAVLTHSLLKSIIEAVVELEKLVGTLRQTVRISVKREVIVLHMSGGKPIESVGGIVMPVDMPAQLMLMVSLFM